MRISILGTGYVATTLAAAWSERDHDIVLGDESVRYYDKNSISVRVSGGATTPTGAVTVVANGIAVGTGTLASGRAMVALDRRLLVPGRYTLEVRY